MRESQLTLSLNYSPPALVDCLFHLENCRCFGAYFLNRMSKQFIYAHAIRRFAWRCGEKVERIELPTSARSSKICVGVEVCLLQTFQYLVVRICCRPQCFYSNNPLGELIVTLAYTGEHVDYIKSRACETLVREEAYGPVDIHGL